MFHGISNTMLLNEVTQFQALLSTVCPTVREEFSEVWRQDLNQVVENRRTLLDSANAVLEYYGSTIRVIGVNYDTSTESLVWLIIKSQESKKRRTLKKKDI